MSEVIFSGDSNPYHMTEHYLRRVLVGDRESVSNRLTAAMERLGYDILDDEESVVRGRREARGWGTSYSSADVLDYPMTLIVRLKPQGDHATRATFDYVVKHPSLSKGEKEILTREAEAISALATVRSIDKICSACGTESTDDSRFCRRCGTKMSVESSELEVLRMSAEIRAGHTSVVSTFIASAAAFGVTGAALLTMLMSGVVFGKGIGTLLIIGLALQFLSVIFVGFGWNRVTRSLKRPKAPDELSAEPAPPLLFPVASQPPTPVGSVTERTTNLLSVERDPAKTGEFPI
ncbi:MAG: zinc ribbon domain-containing protein [Pyrinomonadaceae bacterium]